MEDKEFIKWLLKQLPVGLLTMAYQDWKILQGKAPDINIVVAGHPQPRPPATLIHTDEIKELRKKLDEGVFMIKRDSRGPGQPRKNKDRS